MRVHDALGPGFLESVYRNALAHELQLAGHLVECERRLEVRYRDISVGNFAVDMLVEDCILIELKAARALAVAHEAQLVHYLTATGIDSGLLLNFGTSRLEFRRKFRVYSPRGGKSIRTG